MKIEKVDGLNPSGIKKIEAILAFRLQKITRPDDENRVNVTLAAGSEWESVYFTPNTAEYDVTPKEDKGGRFYEQALTFSIPRFRGKIAKYFDDLAERDFLFKITDRNDNVFLMGARTTRENRKARVTISHKSNFDALNAVSVMVKVEGKSQFPYLINTETIAGGDFNDDFSDDFAIQGAD